MKSETTSTKLSANTSAKEITRFQMADKASDLRILEGNGRRIGISIAARVVVGVTAGLEKADAEA